MELAGSAIGPSKTRSTKVIRPPSLNPFKAFLVIGALDSYADLFLTICLHRINVRYKQSRLGIAWALIQPVALMLIYFVIFSVVTRMPSEGVPYAVFVYAALLPWAYFSTSVSSATSSLVAYREIVTKVYFPREILPCSYVVVGMFDFAIGTSVLAVLMIYYRVTVGAALLWVIPILLVETIFILALSLLCSAIQVQVRDLGVAMPLLMQLWLFASPVVYPLSKVPARLQNLYLLNPMAGVLENFRRVVLQNRGADVRLLCTSFVISAVLLLVAYSYFKLTEATMADVI